MKTASALLSKGYFPRELPLVFTTADFGSHHGDVVAEWIILGLIGQENVKKNRGSFWYKIRDTEAEVISTPKRGYERRFMHVTHPVPQALLATEIGDNWPTIWKWLQRTAYTLDEIKISDNFDRSVKGIDFRLHETKKDFIESTSDWLVRTDISRFYPSIYTHSIPWGAYGKSNVKDDLPKYNGSLADRLDRLVRACNRNQTIGIPIGPETSRIIAEVISSGVDQILMASGRMPVTNLCDRLQDDWFVGLPSFEKCEGCLGALIEAYRQFGLEINGQKTSVNHILSREKIGWRAELLSYFYSVKHMLKGARLKDFLGMALRLQARHPNERIMYYFISLIEDIKVSDDDVPLIESFFLEAVAVAPIATDRICQMLINTSYSTKRVSKTRVSARCLELCEKALAQGNMYEAIWLLYTLRGLDIKISSKMICDNMERHEGSCFPLILLDMQNRGKFAGKLPIVQWENRATPERVERDWLWLLAYEGIRHGWLQDRHSVMNDRLFAPLIARNIVFYDPRRNVPPVSKTRSKRQANLRFSLMSSRELVAKLRGQTFSGY